MGGVVGIDVGGTFVKGGVVVPAGPPLRRRVASPRQRGPQAVVDTVLGLADELTAAATSQGCEVASVGVATLGIVDEDEGVARESVAVGWRDVPLQELLADRLQLPVVVGHDVRAAAAAEAVLGAGKGHRQMVFLPLGTGLAAAQVIDGVVVTGATWRAGEIGQLVVDGGSTADGRLENVASAVALARSYAQAEDLAPEAVDAGTVVEAAVRGDTVAAWELDRSLSALAGVLAVVILFADPSVVVIGGGLSLAGDELLDPLGERVAAAMSWRDPPPLVAARFGDEAGWVGAALLAWRAAGYQGDRFPSGAWP